MNGGEVLCSIAASGDPVWVRDVGSEPRLEKALEGFHHQAARQMVAWDPNVSKMVHGCTHPLGLS